MNHSLADTLDTHYNAILSKQQVPARCVIGFDGFTDDIISVVHTRQDETSYTPMSHITELAERIHEAAGKSCNIECVVKQRKLGGNAPILANALVEGGHKITLIGSMGAPELEPLFQPLAERCERVISLCPSAHTDALEFEDGKVIVGKMGDLPKIDYAMLEQYIPHRELIELFEHTDLFISTNWTMMPHMTQLWQSLCDHIIPHLSIGHERWMFVDISDPAKRTSQDLAQAMHTLQGFAPQFRVVLGLNEAEALKVAHALDIKEAGGSPEKLCDLAERILKTLRLAKIVIHATKFAVSATPSGTQWAEGPFCPKPKLTTGAGDNFNAGYCNALLYGLSDKECLLSGVSTSGYYVRHGKSPTIPELSNFIRTL